MGLGRKIFTRERATSSDVQGYLMDQAVMAFSSASARLAAIPAPAEGMVTYLRDVDRYEGYFVSTWQPISFGAVTSYSPEWTAATSAPNVGTGGSITGRYTRAGTRVAGYIKIVLGPGGGGVTGGRGAWTFSLPVMSSSTAGRQIGGEARVVLSNGQVYRGGVIIEPGASICAIEVPASPSTSAVAPARNSDAAGGVGTSIPAIPGVYAYEAGSAIDIELSYEANL